MPESLRRDDADRDPCRRCPRASTALLCAACVFAPALLAAQARPADSTSHRDSAQSLRRVTVTESATSRRRSAYRVARTSSATRTDALLRDTPQSITIVPQGLIADQDMRGMADVVRYMPGIAMGQGEGHRDAPVIRGQASTADFFVDGIRDDAQYYRDTYNADRVEALTGPNAMTFGRGGGGGVINRVTKDAQWIPVRAARVTGGSFAQRRSTLDIGGRASRTLALRLNGLYENSATFRQQSGGERTGINPTATLMLGSTLVRLGYEFYADRRVVDRGIPSFAGAPIAVPIATFFGDAAESRSRLAAHSASATLDRQLWSGTGRVAALQLRNRSRYTRTDKAYRNVFPGAVNSAGTSVNLQGYDNGTDRTNLFNQTDVTTTVTHGNVRHALLVGAEFGTQHTDNIRTTAYFGSDAGTATTLTVPVTAPAITAPVVFRASATDADSRTTFVTRAGYLQDQAAIGEHVQVIAGVRFDRLTLDYHDNRRAQDLRRTDHLVSPRLGLVLKPVQPLSVYGSASVSFLPGSGDQFGSLTVTTQTLTPERFTNREVGIKWDARRDLSFTAAAYRLDRTNTTAPDPVNAGVVVQTGAQRTTGVELGVSGSPTAHWQVAGGYANQFARIMSRTSAAAAGARVPLVPRQMFSLWNRYQFAPRIGAGVGVVHQAKAYAAIDNTVTLPAFTRVDLATYLTLARSVRAQVNVENLFDTRHYPTSHGNNNIMPGAPRSIRLSLDVTAP